MKTRHQNEQSARYSVAFHTCAVRAQLQAWALLAVGLWLPQTALAQAAPTSEPVATFPEQSNSTVTQEEPLVQPPTPPTPPTVSVAPVVPVAPRPVVPNQPSRSGFYFRFGSGSSLLRLSGTGPSGKAHVTGFGSGVTIAVGGAIAKGLVLSGAMHAISANGDFKGGPFRNSTVTTNGKSVEASSRATASMAEIAAILEYYPSVTRGWHVGAGIGLASSSINNAADGSTYYAMGLGALVQGGYDWHLGKDWCLGLNLVASGSTKGDFKESEHQTSTDYSLRAVSIGMQSALVYF